MNPIISIGQKPGTVVPVYALDQNDRGDGTPGPTALCCVSGFSVDFDGARTTYAPHGSPLPTLDYIGNAHENPHDLTSKWVGVAVDPATGEPYIDADGYYISQNELQDYTKAVNDHARYCPADTFPFISVPPPLFHIAPAALMMLSAPASLYSK